MRFFSIRSYDAPKDPVSVSERRRQSPYIAGVKLARQTLPAIK